MKVIYLSAGGARMYVISYDISSDSIRTKIAKELSNYGRRIQYSVFECELDKSRFQKLYSSLCQLAASMENGNIKIYQICENCQKKIQIIGIPNSDEKYKTEEVIVI